MQNRSEKLNQLFANMPKNMPLNVAVIWPDTKEALRGAIDAARQAIINPIFIGDLERIKKVAFDSGLDLSQYQCLQSELESATDLAAKLVMENKVQSLMKGSLHTEEFMSHVVRRENNLRTELRMSHCMLSDIPVYKKLIIITDVALNIFPNLQEKVSIIKNAIFLAHKIGVQNPKVALLSAIETVSEKIPSTLDSAEVCKMAERGQIIGGIIDGPLAFDAAISTEASLCKKINSPISGDPDILVAPNLEAGNILLKSLEYLANTVSYGIVLGAKVPIILTSRAASAEERTGSCLLAKLLAENKKTNSL